MAYMVSGFIEVASESGWVLACDLAAYVDYGSYASGALFGLARSGGWKEGPLHMRALPSDASAEVQVAITARNAFKAARPSEPCAETWCTVEEAKGEHERLRVHDEEFARDFHARGWGRVLEVAEGLATGLEGTRRSVRLVLFGDC